LQGIRYCFEYLPFSRFLLLSPGSRHSAVAPYTSSSRAVALTRQHSATSSVLKLEVSCEWHVAGYRNRNPFAFVSLNIRIAITRIVDRNEGSILVSYTFFSPPRVGIFNREYEMFS